MKSLEQRRPQHLRDRSASGPTWSRVWDVAFIAVSRDEFGEETLTVAEGGIIQFNASMRSRWRLTRAMAAEGFRDKSDIDIETADPVVVERFQKTDNLAVEHRPLVRRHDKSLGWHRISTVASLHDRVVLTGSRAMNLPVNLLEELE